MRGESERGVAVGQPAAGGSSSATPAKSRNFSGDTRSAAPVGQARTQAAPPVRSLHMSHLTAFFGMSACRWRFGSRPGSAPSPNSSHAAAPAARRAARRRHLDHAVRAVALAVAAADAAVVDEHLAVRRAVDRVGRAVLHAVRVLAVAARGRHVDLRERRAGLAVEPRGAVVRVGAGLLAVVAADAQGLVDQQHVGRLADALLHQEADDAARLGLRLHRDVRAQCARGTAPRAPRAAPAVGATTP